MVKKLTSEDFCSVAHRQAYHGEQEKLAVARLVDQQLRMSPGSRSSASVRAISPPSAHPGEYLAQKISPRDSHTALWVPDQQLAIALLPIEPDSSATIAPVHGAPVHGPSSPISVDGGLRALDASSPAPTDVAAAFRPYSPRVDSFAPNFLPVSARLLAFDRPSIPQSNSQILVDIAAAPIEAVFNEPDQSSIVLETIPAPKAPVPNAVLQAYGAKRFAFSRLPDAKTQQNFSPAPPPPPAVDAPSFDQTKIQSDSYPPASEQFGFPNPSQLHPVSKVALSANFTVGAESVAFDLRPNSLPHPANGLQPGPALSSGPGLCLGLATVAPQPELIAAGTIPRYLARPKVRIPRPPNSAALPAIAVRPATVVVPGNSGAAEYLLTRTVAKCQSFESEAPFPTSFMRVVPSSGVSDRVAPMSQKARVVGIRRSSLEVQPTAFRPSQMLPVPLKAISAVSQPQLRDAVAVERLAIFRPQLKLKIIPARDHGSALAGLSELAGGKFILSWDTLKRRWAEAPNDLRWIAVAVPMVICLIWFANSPGLKDNTKHNVADKVSSIAPNFTGLLNTSIGSESFSGLREGIQRRAAVELSDDFRQGLGEWGGKGDWAKGWNYDPAGFIRPRQLALYTPSIPLENYRFEFLGAIEKKALSWVFRAADLKNYYASRLEITRGGPIPTVELVRFAVIDGRPGPRKSIPLPFQGRMDTIYRVAVEVHGTDFVTTVQGQVVDVFTDDRLARGGVGFYTEAGEDARLRWVEVSHQYDFLGRLCAFLIPYNVSNSNVRSEQ